MKMCFLTVLVYTLYIRYRKAGSSVVYHLQSSYFFMRMVSLKGTDSHFYQPCTHQLTRRLLKNTIIYNWVSASHYCKSILQHEIKSPLVKFSDDYEEKQHCALLSWQKIFPKVPTWKRKENFNTVKMNSTEMYNSSIWQHCQRYINFK
jgi:hypothetical protein